VAYVVDPVRELEGVFAWREGKTAPLPYFWAGNELRSTSAGDARPQREGHAGMATGRGMSADAAAAAPERPATPLAMSLLGWMGLFLMGYMYAGLLSRAEQQQLAEGAVARFAHTKALKLGLDRDLDAVRQTLASVSAELNKLPASNAKLTTEEADTAAKRQRLIAGSLAVCEQALGKIKDQYALSPVEQAAFVQLLAEQQALLKVTPVPKAGSGATPNRPTGKGGAASPVRPGATAAGAAREPADAAGGSAPRTADGASESESKAPGPAGSADDSDAAGPNSN
jgi:hypothetical protein